MIAFRTLDVQSVDGEHSIFVTTVHKLYRFWKEGLNCNASFMQRFFEGDSVPGLSFNSLQ